MSRPAAVLALVITVMVLGCPSAETPPQPRAKPSAAAALVVWRMSKNGLGFRLSDADAQDDRPPAAPKAAPLSEADAAKVLARLPELAAEPDDEKSFALRDRSKPAPRTGKTVSEPFPPPAAPAAAPPVATGPLAVTRKAPVGKVALAPSLTVSFSAPMVALTSHDDLARTPPPVSLSPTPPGKWRWAGSQTLIFDPEKRFPMATEYTVEVPAGTRGGNGQTLAAAERWTFATPPPKLVQSYPNHGPQGLEPVLYAELDQAVDAKTVLAMIRVSGGSAPVELRAATDAEVEEDRAVRRLADKAETRRWLAFKAKAPLEPGKSYVVHLPEGLPSAEGPKRTEHEQTFGFFTYPPFRLSGVECGWGTCPPGNAWQIFFDNPIDTEKFERSWVKVSPEPETLKIDAAGSAITIRPASRGKTKYTVTVAAALTDVFGQTLGKDASANVSVDPAVPRLFAEERDMSVLDPGGPPVLPVFSVNEPSLIVHLYAVEPDDFPKYERWRADWDREGKSSAPPGKEVASRVVKPANKPDELVVTPIDLKPALHDGVGQVLVVVERPGRVPKNPWERQWVRTWVQVTRIGVDAFTDSDSMVAWTTRLADGAPLAGIEVSIAGTNARGTSGADGLARLTLGRSGALVVARSGKDIAFLSAGGGDPFAHWDRGQQRRWFVFDDRGMYKPGEELHAKAWLRSIGFDKGGDVHAAPDAVGHEVQYVIRDARAVELGQGAKTLDATGGFDLSFKLPPTPNLGRATIEFTLDGQRNGEHSFQIEEFRRPEFEANARAGEGPFFVGGHTEVTVAATYYAGGGLPNAAVAFQVTRDDARFVPPNRGDYAFGKGNDGWWIDRRKRAGHEAETWKGRTNPAGEHRVRVDFDAVDPPYPMSLAFEATVTDVNRQAWSARASLLVHPADLYVGVKQERAFVKAGEPIALDVIVTDIDGKAIAGRAVSVQSARCSSALKKGEYVEVETDTDTCSVTSAAAAARCTLKTREGGRYRVTATVEDAHGRKNRTETHVWVMGGSSPADMTLERGRVQIIASKTSYTAGETAELLVAAPFAPAEGLLSVERLGMVHVERFRLESTTGTVRFPVEEAWTPNVVARISLVGAAPSENPRGEPDPSLPKKPAYATGTLALKVPPKARKLDVELKPRDAKIEPGGATVVDLDVHDAAGAPAAGSTATVFVVDEAVLALTAYATPDPLAAFYADRPNFTTELGLRERVLVARPEDKRLEAKTKQDGDFALRGGRARNGHGAASGHMAMKVFAAEAPAPAMAQPPPGAAGKSEGEGAPIKLRKELGALALFAPAVTTDARGHASVDVKLPDSLTRYRVMAVVVSGEQRFGSSESSITARLPLMVRPSAPRFLNYGDRFDLPIVLQNQTDVPLEVDIAARASNALFTAGAGRRVVVPANDRVEVRLPAAAAKAGKARFQIGAASGRWADAAEIELPVWTPATTEAFATYGTIDEGAIAQPVKMASGVERSFGGLEITTSSTAVSALTDAFLYLQRYPFECNEQLSSRVLAVAALRDVLTAFAAKDMPTPKQVEESMAKDIAKLAARQHWSGGWDFWMSDREPWPYLSVHVAHALARAKEKGYAVPKHTLDAALGYLRQIEQHLPGWYGVKERRAIVAYALYVRKRLGDADPGRARRLIAEAGGADRVQIDALGWIWPTLADDASSTADVLALRQHIANRVTETAGAAHFTTSYDDGAYVLLASDRRADGILLEAMIGAEPKNDLIPKLVTGLLGHKKAGRWASTQENAFALLALDRYFATYEKATPDFVARAWLGDRYAGEHAFKGRTTERHEVDIPMAAVAEMGSGNLFLAKDGPGRLYYRIGMTYAPSDLRPPPAEHGFSVSRVYEAVDEPSDVRRDDDGVWHVKAGAKVRVRLTMVVPARRYHVALVDGLPAGLEVMNPALAVTGAVPHDPKTEPSTSVPWWWSRTWYEHQNIRDERVEAFASLLWEGVYDYTYVARATTPGVFVVPPPKAEEMYSPETFGRGRGDRLIVEG
jgi:uncharacterized protein YfaS (alpha-2-macroglobulin family)